MERSKVAYVRPEELGTIPELTPPVDPTLDVLLKLAVAGELKVYFAAVPTPLIGPYSVESQPLSHSVGVAAVDQAVRDGMSGRSWKVWLYEGEKGFILSDDYIAWEATKRGQPDYVPAFVLGRPQNPLVKDIQGPVDVRQALGWK